MGREKLFCSSGPQERVDAESKFIPSVDPAGPGIQIDKQNGSHMLSECYQTHQAVHFPSPSLLTR